MILEFEPGRRLVNTHHSPLSGQPDLPNSRHTLTWTLDGDDDTTRLTLAHDNNPRPAAALHSHGMWDSLVASVKSIAERR
ncbi:hypothetical protein GCM10027056_22980 [Glaciibacter psychrotolerans]